MRKTFKTQGTLEQWTTLITLSLEQMQLESDVQDNVILGLHGGMQVMKFEVVEDNGIVVHIDYFDGQDLNDFRRFAAQIIKNPDAYRKAEEPETVPEPAADADQTDYRAEDFYQPSEPAGNQINDFIHQPQVESPADPVSVKPVKKNKTLPAILIILGILIVVAVAGILGYRYYRQKQIPMQLLSQAVTQFESGDFEAAIANADVILTEYPNSDQAYSAQALKDNANKEIERLAYEAQLKARMEVAKSMFAINSRTMTGPDEDGDVHLFFGYTNLYTSDITGVNFGVTFIDAAGAIALTENEGTEVVVCTDSQGLAANSTLDAGSIVNFGPYRNATIADYQLVSVEVTYADGTVLSLGTTDEVSWVFVQ